jgi:hypothetical protein
MMKGEARTGLDSSALLSVFVVPSHVCREGFGVALVLRAAGTSDLVETAF